MNRSILFVGSVFALGAAVVAGCGGSEVPVLQNNNAANLNALDAGTGKCGAAACASGELCCASADESCTPTCTKTASCPAYGRPCSVADAGQADAGGQTDASPAPYQWYTTCGDPVCRDTDAGGPTVACAAVGSSCTTKGETCGNPSANCGVIQVCDDHDPKGGTGGCPISTQKAKQDIAYVSDAELARLHDETMRMKLATYRYKGPFIDPKDPNATHLGFIVEDQPQSMSVDRGHDRVDLYGYMSMAVATMQVQEQKLEALRKQVDALEAACPKARRQ
jgi:hypothetical protein